MFTFWKETTELALSEGFSALRASDTGVGLPAQQADDIFNSFFTTKLEGTGLGLSISRSIVESHGGRLWAAANSPRGASFYFTLSTKVEADQ
jgi:signal transduction histidine kinase